MFGRLLGRVKPEPLELTYRQYFRIAFIADIHFGETRAVFPNEFELSDGQVVLANEAQKILYNHWIRVSKLLDKYKVHCICLPGDLIAGTNNLEGGRFLNPHRIPEQIRGVVDLLSPICRDRKVLIWRGTGYHEYPKGVGEVHEEIAQRLKANGVDVEFQGLHSYIELQGPKRTRRIFVAHESPQYLVYPPNLAARDIQWAIMSEANGSTLAVDAIFRAHLHTWFHLDYMGKHAVQLPCWLAHSPYKQTSKYFFRLQPTIGAALLLVDEEGRMDIWGGSYPWCLPKEEKIALHKACVKVKPLNYTTMPEQEVIAPESESIKLKGQGPVLTAI